MDSIVGFMSTSVSAKSVVVKFVTSTSTSSLSNSSLSSSANFSSSPFLKFSNSSPKSTSIHGLQSRRHVPEQSVLIDREISKSVQEAIHSHDASLLKSYSPEVSERSLRREMTPLHQLRLGGFAEEHPQVYRQIFVVRSYEVGPDKSTSIREIVSLFQEIGVNHMQLLGITDDGFGSTRGMNRRGLIWVVTKMQVHVERYPSWPEVIEIDSWLAEAGKNSMRRDWVMRSYRTGEVLARATSTWCMINGTTRRLSKFPEDVRDEVKPALVQSKTAFRDNECAATRIAKLDEGSTEHQRSELTSTPADLDMNQHVNNLKYINWVLESIPVNHMETHKLATIVLEYRRECHSTDVVESLTGSKSSINCQDGDSDVRNGVELAMDGAAANPSCCQYTHLLRTQGAVQQEILRGKTTWRPRTVDGSAAC